MEFLTAFLRYGMELLVLSVCLTHIGLVPYKVRVK